MNPLVHVAPRPLQSSLTWRAWLPPIRKAAAALVVAALTGCATVPPPATTAINPPVTTPGGIPIDVSVTARGQDSRVMFLIIHYTVLDLPNSIRVLTQNEVSSHYLLTDHASPRIMRLVDEFQRAWHAGPSSWKGNRQLNASSIGIEIVHPGARIGPNGEREYLPFPPEQINALIPFEFIGQPVDDAHVKVFAAEEGVAVGRFNLKNAVANLEDGHVEGAAAEVEDRDFFLAFLIQAISQGGCGRLVDDPQYIESGDLAPVLGGLALGIVKIGGDGDYGVGDRLAQILLGGLFHLPEDHR